MTNSIKHIFHGMQLIYEAKWLSNQAVIIEAGKITAVIPAEMIKHHLPATVHEYPSSYYLSPGFIDLHIHGAKGADVMDATEEALSTIAEALASEGVTGFLATTMTADSAQIDQALQAIAKYQEQPHSAGAALLGAHLEGPFIAKDKMGAQKPDHITLPSMSVFKQWQAISNNAIKLVTLAPELPEVIPFIRSLREAGVIVSIGHTNATYAETQEAIHAGCTQGTHLFNAMRGLHQREPGVAAALLLDEKVSVELIADGIHLHPAMLKIALKMKSAEDILLVTDAMRAKCLGDGQYDLGGQAVSVQNGRATIAGDVLAGSTLRMSEAINNMVAFTGCSLIQAIHMASLQPANKLGLSTKKGRVAVGYDADLVVLDDKRNVVLTMRHGEIIYSV